MTNEKAKQAKPKSEKPSSFLLKNTLQQWDKDLYRKEVH